MNVRVQFFYCETTKNWWWCVFKNNNVMARGNADKDQAERDLRNYMKRNQAELYE